MGGRGTVGSGRARGFQRRLIVPALAGALALVVSGAGAAEIFVRPSDHAAVSARVLQSDILVAALLCGERARYNLVIKKFEPELARQGAALRRIFERDHGREGRRHLDRFVTALANEASQRSLEARDEFCIAAGQLFDRLLALPGHQFEAFVAGRAAVADRHPRPRAVRLSASRED